MAKGLTCYLDGNDIVLDDSNLRISFRRTIRVPDNTQVSFLPPGLGPFPLKPVSHDANKLPKNMAAKGGLFLPIYQSEAMWLNFEARKPYMIKIYVGGVKAISGKPTVETAVSKLRQAKLAALKSNFGREWDNASPRQDYIVVPHQLWLDGIADSDGSVRQFVAMPFGSGYSVECQVTGQDTTGGLQFEITPFDPLPPLPPSLPARIMKMYTP